jgi:hypothetical protein
MWFSRAGISAILLHGFEPFHLQNISQQLIVEVLRT